ncbi:MAG: SCO family protein [Reichenbachiella sp.]
MINKGILYIILFTPLIVSCNKEAKKFKLPVYGRPTITETVVNGIMKSDTVLHQVAPFAFYNQDSLVVNNDSFKDKIYIADFFFTSCPTICPVMKKQMLKVYDKYLNNDTISILSHTIDPEYDNISVLKTYANALGVESPKWNFVTGKQEDIYDIAESSYMVTAGEDNEAPGGYIHGGAFILVDPNRRIRGVYDGTNEDQVNVLLSDIDWLLKEVNEK